MTPLRFLGKRFVLGVCGSIAAYKAAGLVRALVKEGAEVSVVMTESATRFVTPLTFETLTKRPVHTDLFSSHQEMLHLSLPVSQMLRRLANDAEAPGQVHLQ